MCLGKKSNGETCGQGSTKYFKENIAYLNIIYVIATAAGAAIVYCMMNPLRKY